MKILGRHIIAEYADCNCQKLDDMEFLEQSMLEAVRRSGATVVRSVFHRYAPQGVSGVIVIAESHMSIHTWPEYGYAAVDLFTCGQTVDPYKAHSSLQAALESDSGSIKELDRGIPSETDETLQHKNFSSPIATAAG